MPCWAKTFGVAYIFDDRIGGTVTARSTKTIPRESVLPMLKNILALNGAALVKTSGAYHVVPLDSVHSLPKTVVKPGTRPLQQRTGIYVVPLDHAPAASLAEVVTGQLGPGSQVAADTERDILIFTGTANDARMVAELVSVLEADALADKSFALFAVQTARAEDVLEELQAMFSSESGSIKFLPISRLNAVLAVARKPSALQRVGQWVKRLDKADTRAGVQTFVYYAKNSRATEQRAVAPGLDPARPTSATTEGGEGVDAQTAQAAVASSGTSRSSGTQGVRFVADEAHNALVIMATAQQIELIRDVLDRIGVMPLQVLIEATIADVTLNDELRYGVQWALSQGDFAINWVNGSSGAVSSAFAGSNLSFENADAQIVLSALSDVTDVQVISSPQLMVLDNQSARLQIGDQVPVLTQSAVSTTDPNSVVVNSVQYVDTGVIFEVTPRVNSSGLVTLDILQEVSDPSGTSASNIQSPTIQQRRIQGTKTVQSGATIGLAGLIRERSSNASGAFRC